MERHPFGEVAQAARRGSDWSIHGPAKEVPVLLGVAGVKISAREAFDGGMKLAIQSRPAEQ